MGEDSHGDTDVPFDGMAGMRMVGRQYIGAEFFGEKCACRRESLDGVHALDAAVSAYNNISLLQQQIKPDERIHNVSSRLGKDGERDPCVCQGGLSST